MNVLAPNSENLDSLVYTGEKAYHGLGEQVSPEMAVDDMLIRAGLDWHVAKRPVYYPSFVDGKMVPTEAKNRKAIVRVNKDQTTDCLHIASDKFKVHQTHNLVESLTPILGDWKMDVIGSLFGGRKIWMLAKHDDQIRLKGNDVMSKYMLFGTSFDGTISTWIIPTNIRAVCDNFLSMAIRKDGKKGLSVRHTSIFNTEYVADQVQKMTAITMNHEAQIETLADAKISDAEAIKFFISQYVKLDDEGNVKNEKTVEKVTGRLVELYRNGPGANLTSAKSTMWGALNAVTHYVDHESNCRSVNNRFDSAQFGAGAVIKNNSFAEALRLVA